jgi:hypothetical protein
MIIGTFRQTPLPDRPPESFPDTVARAIQRSRVCALTGLDLYCFLQEAKIDPTRKPNFVNKLFGNNGPISAKDWHMFISEKGAVGPEGEPSGQAARTNLSTRTPMNGRQRPRPRPVDRLVQGLPTPNRARPRRDGPAVRRGNHGASIGAPGSSAPAAATVGLRQSGYNSRRTLIKLGPTKI